MKHMEILRRKLVYELFIDQFVEMSRVSIKYRSLQQTMSLLKQAERICLLLKDDKFHEEAEKQLTKIDALKESVETLAKEASLAPELPRRESVVDKLATAIRFRPPKPIEGNYTSIDRQSSIDEVPSDDDNDEIYNYHRSVVAQIHATSAENLARFQHSDERDDVEEITNSLEKLEVNLREGNSDYESDYATQI